MAKNEKVVQTLILDDLRSLGRYCECFKIMKASDVGEPDIFFTTRLTGAVLIETKRLKGKPQKIQEIKIEKLTKCGTPTFVCHGWEEWMKIKMRFGLTKESVIRAHHENINFRDRNHRLNFK